MLRKSILSLAALLTGVSSAVASTEADLYITDGMAKAGSTVVVSVMSTGEASGFQFNVVAPTGVAVSKVARGANIKVVDESDEYIFVTQNSNQADGSKLVTCYSNNSQTAEVGEIFKITLTLDASLAVGVYDLKLEGIVCSYINSSINTYKEYTAKLTVVPEKETVSVSSLGLATYCPAYPVDFSSAANIWAYKAAVDGSTVKLTKVATVAAGEGVLLRALSGGAKTEELPIADFSTTAATDNEFVGTLADKQVYQTDGDKTNYVLSAETTGVGFYKAKLETDGGTTVPAGKAYLPVITSLLNDVNSFSIGWEDEATGIVSLKVGNDAEAVYNLQGVRVEQPNKGLYIRNGKKIVIK